MQTRNPVSMRLIDATHSQEGQGAVPRFKANSACSEVY